MFKLNVYRRRDALKIFAATGCVAPYFLSETKAQDQTINYSFNKSFPPRLKDNYDILAVPLEKLRVEVGKYAQSEKPIDVPLTIVNGNLKYRREFHNIIINRYMYWAIKDGPFHPAADYTQKLEKTKGYELTKKQEFEKTITTEIGASLGDVKSFLKLSESMRDSLKMGSTDIQFWKEESKETIEQKFLENHTYVTWCLYDEMHAVHDATGQILDTPGMNVMYGIPPLHIESTISCVLNTFQDSIADADIK